MEQSLPDLLAAVVYLALCFGIGKFAKVCERSFLVWFVLAVLNPIITLALLVILNVRSYRRKEEVVRSQRGKTESHKERSEERMFYLLLWVSIVCAFLFGMYLSLVAAQEKQGIVRYLFLCVGFVVGFAIPASYTMLGFFFSHAMAWDHVEDLTKRDYIVVCVAALLVVLLAGCFAVWLFSN